MAVLGTSVRNFEFGPLVQVFSFEDHFVKWIRIICAILVEGIIRNICIKSFRSVVQEERLLKEKVYR